MENIKFIREIMRYGTNKNGQEFGDCMYYKLNNGNKAKVYVEGGNIHGQSYGIIVNIINNTEGKVDTMYFPFANYFKPTQCSAGAPTWYQHVDRGRWYFSETYNHVLPTVSDFKNIATAVCEYMEMYS